MTSKKEYKKGICGYEGCKKEFTAKRRGIDQKYCSSKCAWRAWEERNPRVKVQS